MLLKVTWLILRNHKFYFSKISFQNLWVMQQLHKAFQQILVEARGHVLPMFPLALTISWTLRCGDTPPRSAGIPLLLRNVPIWFPSPPACYGNWLSGAVCSAASHPSGSSNRIYIHALQIPMSRYKAVEFPHIPLGIAVGLPCSFRCVASRYGFTDKAGFSPACRQAGRFFFLWYCKSNHHKLAGLDVLITFP